MDEYSYRSAAEIHDGVSWPGELCNHGNQVIQLLHLPDCTDIWHFPCKKTQKPKHSFHLSIKWEKIDFNIKFIQKPPKNN